MQTKTIEVIDHIATGERHRKRRKLCQLTLREVARRLKLSVPYISDLERGRTNWSEELEARFAKALK